ncbi:DNA helicase PIF1, ATP-dependent [Corchorus olitorius]|uniref:ATP-dependent DNA helicase n=1 Tax=Corchorus olitorius TaxID=93759 RepID=A0A1R3KJR5_9ROSI|nr:DNA helicase PIF1, ATP-dependent [Corchorus olitorius]
MAGLHLLRGFSAMQDALVLFFHWFISHGVYYCQSVSTHECFDIDLRLDIRSRFSHICTLSSVILYYGMKRRRETVKQKPLKPIPAVNALQARSNRRKRITMAAERRMGQATASPCTVNDYVQESVDCVGSGGAPVFSLCCKQGMIRLPQPMPTPPLLSELLDYTRGGIQQHFRENIRVYNSLFQLTSLGGRIDDSINDGSGPFIFRLNRQTYHRIGSLLPVPGTRPKFSQLYIYDTDNEISNRVSALTNDTSDGNINRLLVEALGNLFDGSNEVVKAFRVARDKLQGAEDLRFRLRLVSSRNRSERNYAPPTAPQIAALIVQDSGQVDAYRDIIVQHRDDRLQRINTTHPLYMALQYPILFPYGEDGFTLDIEYVESPVKRSLQRGFVTMREYYSYIIQQRDPERSTLIRGGRLFQQFLVDAYCAVAQAKLEFIKHNQKKIMAEMYREVSDAMNEGDTDGGSIGKRIVLPASFTGSPRYMFQSYQDAIAICRHFGFPDLFITFTCNANWPEIQQALSFIPKQRPEDRPDIVARVFKMKLDCLLNDIMKDEYFGPTLAELPDPLLDRIGYEAASTFMMHGPCGVARPSAPCLVNSHCDKFYPKQFQTQTRLDESGYYLYRRRDTSITCKKAGIELDNRFVVPHNLDLVIKYQAHINVVVCTHNSAMKEPAVIRLPVHLSRQHNIYFHDDEPLDAVLGAPNIEKTMLSEWFVANSKYESARSYLYVDFPAAWVWHGKTKEWKPRQRGRAIGRVIHINHAAGELFYLRLLLNVVRGPRSYEELRTVGGVLYPTFQGACEALQLLGNDNEWQESFDQSIIRVLCPVFIDVGLCLPVCEVSNPATFFERNWKLMSDDIQHQFFRGLGIQNYRMPDPDLRNYVLLSLEEMLTRNCTSLAEKNLPQTTIISSNASLNRLLREEVSYDQQKLAELHNQMLSALNPEQRHAYYLIRESVNNHEGKLYFVNGHGGTRKTFLWGAIISGMRAAGRIVLVVASFGIASLLLPGGRTAHSRFKIPLTIDEWSTCEIRKGTNLAELLRQTSLVVWDEAPMIHRYCFEALDRSLRDVLSDLSAARQDQPFGGLTVVMGGDFRQILPVVPRGDKADILHATICTSPLMEACHVLRLSTNMRLLQPGLSSNTREQLQFFAQWLLEVGDGSIRKNYAEPLYVRERAVVTPFNDTADQLNRFILKKIPAESTTYFSSDTISASDNGSEDLSSLYPSELLQKISIAGVPDHELTLKVGCAVMLMRNVNPVIGLCNGTRLLILQLTRTVVEAKILTGDHLGDKVYIPRIIFTVKDPRWPFVLSRRQFPLKLSYVMTINKSQGQTLNFIGVFLPRPVFTHGRSLASVGNSILHAAECDSESSETTEIDLSFREDENQAWISTLFKFDLASVTTKYTIEVMLNEINVSLDEDLSVLYKDQYERCLRVPKRPISFFIYNTRGAVSPSFLAHFQRIMHNYKPDLIVLTETRSSDDIPALTSAAAH